MKYIRDIPGQFVAAVALSLAFEQVWPRAVEILRKYFRRVGGTMDDDFADIRRSCRWVTGFQERLAPNEKRDT